MKIDYKKLWEICCRCEAPCKCNSDYELGYYVEHGKFPCKTLNDEMEETNLCATCRERKQYLEADEDKRYYMATSRAECKILDQTKTRCHSYVPDER